MGKKLRSLPTTDWMGNPIKQAIEPGTSAVSEGNPMVDIHGKGPLGRRCEGCIHLVGIAYSRSVYKCDEREDLTHSRKTDQKKSWPACAKFEDRGSRPMNWYDGR